MEIDAREMELLNFYRASELRGGLLLSTIAQRVRDGALFVELARHGAEEIVHAQLWAETMVDLGGRPWPTRRTAQGLYAGVVGRPTGLLSVMALTQVFERTVYWHFMERWRDASTHPRIRQTLERMIEEEKGHLSWVKRWLDRQAATRPDAVHETMRRFTAADRVVRARFDAEYGWGRAA